MNVSIKMICIYLLFIVLSFDDRTFLYANRDVDTDKAFNFISRICRDVKFERGFSCVGERWRPGWAKTDYEDPGLHTQWIRELFIKAHTNKNQNKIGTMHLAHVVPYKFIYNEILYGLAEMWIPNNGLKNDTKKKEKSKRPSMKTQTKNKKPKKSKNNRIGYRSVLTFLIELYTLDREAVVHVPNPTPDGNIELVNQPDPNKHSSNYGANNGQPGYINANGVDLKEVNLKELTKVIKLLLDIDFTKHNDDIDVKTKNCNNICKIIRKANSAPANLRFGDSSTNEGIGNRLDPMGNKDKKLTKKEARLLTRYGYKRKLENGKRSPENKLNVLETYPFIEEKQPFIISSTGQETKHYGDKDRYIVESDNSFNDYINSLIKSLSHKL